MTRVMLVILAVVLVATASVAALAETSVKPATAPKNVTIELTDTTVAEAVSRLFKDTKLSYILQPGVVGTISSLSLKDVPFDSALKSLVKAAGLETSIEDGIYIIGKNLKANESAQAAVVVKSDSNPSAANQVNYQPQEMQDPSLGYYPQQYPPAYQQGPDQQPVYYGPYTQQQGYYYNPGYNNYPRMVTPPAYQPYRRNYLPGPGSVWSAGIGPVKISKPQSDKNTN